MSLLTAPSLPADGWAPPWDLSGLAGSPSHDAIANSGLQFMATIVSYTCIRNVGT